MMQLCYESECIYSIMSNVETTLDATPQPNAPAGVYTISVTFENKIDSPSVENLFFEVMTLTNGNQPLNVDGTPGGAGASLTVPATTLGADGRCHLANHSTSTLSLVCKSAAASNSLSISMGRLMAFLLPIGVLC